MFSWINQLISIPLQVCTVIPNHVLDDVGARIRYQIGLVE